jgi:hypothetical protein
MSSDASVEMTTPSNGLAESILGRLPTELSNKAYEFLMEGDLIMRSGSHRLQGTTEHTTQEAKPLTLRQKLAPLQVCREMRSVAIGYFFQNPVWLMHLKRTPTDYHTANGDPNGP